MRQEQRLTNRKKMIRPRTTPPPPRVIAVGSPADPTPPRLLLLSPPLRLRLPPPLQPLLPVLLLVLLRIVALLLLLLGLLRQGQEER